MTRIYLADPRPEERYALRLLINDLNMEVAGESTNWFTTLHQARGSNADIFLVDWDLLPNQASEGLQELRKEAPEAVIILIISHPDPNQRALLGDEVNMFISKSDPPERIADWLRLAATKIKTISQNANGKGDQKQH